MKKYIILTVVFLFLIISGVLFYNYRNNTSAPSAPVRVLVITDINYIMQTKALIRSICANKKPKTQVEVNVITLDFYLDDVIKLQNESKRNVKVNVINQTHNQIPHLDGGTTFNPFVSRADNFKFFIPEIIPDYDKILYLDGDIIVLKDLSELYNTDLGDNYAAVVDDWQTNWGKERKNERYFNNGVMLLNLAQMRKDNICPKLIKAKEQDKLKRFVTQDAFNEVMKDKVVYLPLIYDTFAPEYERDFVLDKIKEVLRDNYDEKMYPYKTPEEFRKNVVILHYCGWFNAKPWQILDYKRSTNLIWYYYAPFEFWLNQTP